MTMTKLIVGSAIGTIIGICIVGAIVLNLKCSYDNCSYL